jgi:cytochrome c oxidase cbb3-type subunit 2
MISFHTNHRLLLVAPALTFALLTTVIAILPAIYENRLWPGDPDRKPLPADVARGRELYIAEGCSYCHTQQVRVDTRRPVGPDGRFPPLAADARWGRPTTPADYADQDPPLLGTQRTGPDLADAGGRLPSPDWQFTHLYDPRLVVPDSRMPAYRWYFHTGDERAEGDREVLLPASVIEQKGKGFRVFAKKDAQALVAYILSLKTGTVPPARSGPAAK